MLNALAKNVPWMIGGAADLSPSTKTNLTFEGAGSFEADNYGGRNLHFGIREHAMGSDLQRHGAVRAARLWLRLPDLLRLHEGADPAVRASWSCRPSTSSPTTSIGVGEDGPTHQPVEQIASLRAMPGMITLRPADANEIAEAWRR